MPSVPAITLYDILSRLTPPAWTPNVWKARIVLNYKRIPYRTVWVSYPDIEATAKKLGCSYNRMQGSEPLYTLPVIVDNSGHDRVVVSDSLEIAKYLDAKFPDRPVLPKTGIALEYAFEECLSNLIGRHFGPVMTMPTYRILDERGKAYFRETRERWFGKPIEERCTDRAGGWEKITQGFDKIATMLDQNGPGVEFIAGGKGPTRADIILMSYLIYIRAVALEEGWVERLQNSNGGRWQKLWDRSEEWSTVH